MGPGNGDVLETKAIQDIYPEDYAWCYGCGRRNETGLHLKTVWDGEKTVTTYTPREEHIAIPGFVYGGLLASLIDCHGTGSAADDAFDHEAALGFIKLWGLPTKVHATVNQTHANMGESVKEAILDVKEREDLPL